MPGGVLGARDTVMMETKIPAFRNHWYTHHFLALLLISSIESECLTDSPQNKVYTESDGEYYEDYEDCHRGPGLGE